MRLLAMLVLALATVVITELPLMGAARVAHAQAPDSDIPEFSPRWTAYDTLLAIENASPRVRCIVISEVGNSRTNFDPYTVSATRDHGIAGLHEGGKLVDFYRAGYTDPYSPYQSVRFLTEQIAAGQGWAWVGDRDHRGGWC